MQRWLSIIVGIAVICLAVAVVARGFAPPKSLGLGDAEAASLDARSADALASDSGDGGALADAIAFDLSADGSAWLNMSDGTPVPVMPDKTPKMVRVGVVLVTYAGAQGAPANARSRSDAVALAERLAKDAETDFHSAVQRGDPGSSDDVGRIPRGFLEPAPEYTLFTLAVGGVSGPVDTPRGFWIMKRLD